MLELPALGFSHAVPELLHHLYGKLSLLVKLSVHSYFVLIELNPEHFVILLKSPLYLMFLLLRHSIISSLKVLLIGNTTADTLEQMGEIQPFLRGHRVLGGLLRLLLLKLHSFVALQFP